MNKYQEALNEIADDLYRLEEMDTCGDVYCFDNENVEILKELVEKQSKIGNWVTCNQKLPENLQEVVVTFINKRPPMYYESIRNVPMVAFAIYYKDEWYWWASTVGDLLAEYGKCESELIDKDIEITAWMPLPEPYKRIKNEI